MLESRKRIITRFLNNKFFNLGNLNEKSLAIYEQALTHRSYANEQKGQGNDCSDNERLEFFGNFVLGMIVSEYLFRKFEFSEGEMTKRMVIVSDAKLAEIIKRKKVGINKRTIKLGKPQLGQNKLLEDSIIASTFEALIGAVYLDKGIRKSKEVVLNVLSDDLTNSNLDTNYIGLLQELVQKNKLGELSSKEKRLTGPDHKPTFNSVIKLSGKKIGEGVGKSKKAAKMNASKVALKKLKRSRSKKE